MLQIFNKNIWIWNCVTKTNLDRVKASVACAGSKDSGVNQLHDYWNRNSPTHANVGGNKGTLASHFKKLYGAPEAFKIRKVHENPSNKTNETNLETLVNQIYDLPNYIKDRYNVHQEIKRIPN